jgi:Fe-S-cluster-containing dehydrogenase component/formate-dependent nitrite reductase membrane component NrfD
MVTETAAEPAGAVKWAKVIDHTRCIGCHACTTACKSENQVPLSVTRTYVKYVDVGEFPQTRRAFQVTRCNQCEYAPCVTACPTSAMFRRADGIVDFDKSICIGCKACIAACPYDAIFINPEDHSAEKCNFCAHRLDVGLEPACVVVCPTEAILVGDLNDPLARVTEIVNRDAVTVRRPEKDTRPKLFYKGAHQATLDPIAARRPEGGLFMWSEQGDVPHQVTSGHPGSWNSSAAAVLSYDIPHRAPWDWRVSLYTWTKGVSAGVYLVGLALVLAGLVPGAGAFWGVAVPVVAGVFLALTGALLIWDLDHPERFHLIFTRPQWKSWLVKGGFVIGGYGLVLALQFAAGVAGALDYRSWVGSVQLWLIIAGAPLAIFTAIYTAYLFAQAKARDLWQNPLAPVHLLVQAALAGAGVTLLLPGLGAAPRTACLWILAGASLAHLFLLAAEHPLAHTTAHAKLAYHEMTRGRYGRWFQAGAALVVVGLAAPWIGAAGAVAALIGLFAYEHAYVQAGQAVPLA